MTIRSESVAASGATKSFHIDILDQSKKGLGLLLGEIFRKFQPDYPRLNIQITDEDEENLFKSIYKQEKQIKGGQPVLRIQEQTYTRGTEYLNRHVMMTNGINAGLMKDRQHVLVIHGYPYISDFLVSLYTDDSQLMRNAIHAMGFIEEQRVEYSVDLEDPKFTFPIRTVFPDSFSVPPRATIGDVYSGYRLDFQVGMRTWMVKAERVPTLQKIKFVPHAVTSHQFEQINKSVEDYNAGISTDEAWSESDLEFTIDLRNYATSDTVD